MRLEVTKSKTKGKYAAQIKHNDGVAEVLGESYKSVTDAQSALRKWLHEQRKS